jgi:hypothetical protein
MNLRVSTAPTLVPDPLQIELINMSEPSPVGQLGKPSEGQSLVQPEVGSSKSTSTQSTQVIASGASTPPMILVRIQEVARRAVDDMNRNGNRDFSFLGPPSAWVGNIVDNVSSKVGIENRIWKCEDQAPYLADRINRAGIPGVRAGVQNSNSHSWVIVNVGGKQNWDGSVTGGQNYYIDPWASGDKLVRQPETPAQTIWDESIIRSNIEPDAPP